MAIDVQPVTADVPAEHRIFTRQNFFPSIYRPPQRDLINVNIYQDFAYALIASKSHFLMTTGVNVVLDHVFEFGPFCTYMVGQTINKHSDSLKSNLFLNSYFYCGNMFAYVPLADKKFHPKVFFDIGLGNANGTAVTERTSIAKSTNYVFMVLKPAAALEMNLLWFLQWTVAVQYRFQIDLGGPSSDMGGKASGLEISTGPVFQF